MDGSALDSQLIEITSGPPPTTIADVLNLIQRIDDLLPNGDGLKWFNLLYMMVTQQVDSSPPPGGWEDSAWLTRLDVVFAQLISQQSCIGRTTPQTSPVRGRPYSRLVFVPALNASSLLWLE